MNDQINVLHRTQSLIVSPSLKTISIVNGMGPAGPEGPQGVPGSGAVASAHVVLQSLQMSASAAATNNGASTFTAVGDPNFRQVIFTTAAISTVFLQGRLGGTVAAGTKLRVQYAPTTDMNLGTSDSAWATLIDSAGSHTANVSFLSTAAVPGGAIGATCLLRCGIYGGDGAADPTITACILNFT